jgi:hypothetical protein
VNKKGDYTIGKESLKMIVYLMLITVVSFIIISIFGVSIVKDIRTSELEQHVAVTRMLSSSNCLAYSGEERVFSGIIDLNKFSEERVQNCFSYKEREGQGLLLSLYDFNDNLLGEVETNKILVAQVPTCGLDKSDYDCYFTRKYILYDDGGEMKKGFLDFTVVTKLE